MIVKGEQVWTTLLRAGIVKGDEPERAEMEAPWFVRVLLAFSGWLAALFLLGFIGMGFEFVFKNNTAAFIIGTLLTGAAFAILRIPNNEFVEHLALAASLAGQALIVFSIFEFSNQDERIAWLLVALLQVILSLAMPSFVHRVFSSFVAVVAFSMAIRIMGFPSAMGGIVLFLSVMCWLNEFRYPQHMEKMRAIGYGLVLSLTLLQGVELLGSGGMGWLFGTYSSGRVSYPWIGEIVIGLVALYVVWHVLQRYNQGIWGRFSILAFWGTLLMIAVSLEVQGITVGIVIMMLGYCSSNRLLLGLGIVSLLFYISSYYYLLDATLLDKSKTLLIVGLALLVIRLIMLRIVPVKNGGQHA